MNFDIGQKITATFNPNASSRTKNRIRERGPVFILRDLPDFTLFPGNRGVKWIMLQADDGWFGWLPMDEIELSTEAT